VNRPARLLVIALVTLGLAWPAASPAQRDRLGVGEDFKAKVIRPDTSEYEITVKQEPGERPKTIQGELRAQKLPRQVQAALAFLIRWGGGPSTPPKVPRLALDPATPVEVAGRLYALRDVTMLPPVVGLSILRDPAGTATGVAVRSIAVRTRDGELRGRGVLHTETEPDGWVSVRRVTITP
jgi:hypothetical protein